MSRLTDTELRLVELLLQAGGVPETPAAIDGRPDLAADLTTEPRPRGSDRRLSLLRSAVPDVLATGTPHGAVVTYASAADLLAIRETHR